MMSTPASRPFALLIATVFCGATIALSGCATGANQAESDDTEVGQPPAEGEADREPANPPKGPSVDMSDGGEGEPEQEQAATPPSEDAPTVTPAEIETFMEKGPPYALTVTRVEPHRINGAFAGFEIIAMHPSAKRFVDPELAVGDVVTHINGVRMKKPDDYLAAWKLLDDVDAIRIKYTRDGEQREAVWRVVGADDASNTSADSSQ